MRTAPSSRRRGRGCGRTWPRASARAASNFGGKPPAPGTRTTPRAAWRAQQSAARGRAYVTARSNAGDVTGARRALAPYVRAKNPQAVIDRLDVSSPRDGAVFWSGAKEAAKARAQEIGGVALETTPGGRVIDDWQLLNESFRWEQGGKELWGGISTRYAQGATGKVHVVQSEYKAAQGGGDVWKEFELPELLRQQRRGRVTEILPPEIVPNPPR